MTIKAGEKPDKIFRQQIEDRDDFTYEERQRIAMKSGERCCRCGKKVYFGYGATVDHFVPIARGGTNDPANLVMLCRDCNQEKGAAVVSPKYLRYLSQEAREDLKDYFFHYIESYDYVTRKNVLCCDWYEVWVDAYEYNSLDKNKQRRLSSKMPGTYHLIKRALPDDIDKLTEYFIGYLKHYDALDSEVTARRNIEFWLTFGCIYYIERCGEICLMAVITVTKENEPIFELKEGGGRSTEDLSITLFSKYANQKAKVMADGIISTITDEILYENNLPCLPVALKLLPMDKLRLFFSVLYQCEFYPEGVSPLFSAKLLFRGPGDNIESVTEYFERFHGVAKKLDDWMKREPDLEEDIGWMRNEVIPYTEDSEDIGNTP